MQTDKGQVDVRLTSRGNVEVDNRLEQNGPAIFLPSREVLSMCYSLRTAYEEVQLNFDETYYDLAKMLQRPTLLGPRGEKAASLIKPLEDIVNGKVTEENGIFYVNSAEGKIEAHLLAEGWRKIASLCRLISNGSLDKKSFLFWDEPEANLNPKLIVPICNILRQLASDGVQIFISTHDFLIANELSLIAEYNEQQPKPLRTDIRFFALNRDISGDVRVESGNTLADLEHNDILEEFAAHYDRAHELFSRSMQGQVGAKTK